MFQRRHFEAMANEVMTWEKTLTKTQIVDYLCSLFEYYSPHFKPEKFKKACESFEGELSG